MINIFEENLVKLTKKYGNMVLLYGENTKNFRGVLQYFRGKSFNLGLGEQNMASCAVGFVVTGKIPMIICDSAFVRNAFSQIYEGICVPNLNVKIVVLGGGDLDGIDLAEKLPNMKIFKPESEEEIICAMEEMFSEYGPVCLRLKI